MEARSLTVTGRIFLIDEGWGSGLTTTDRKMTDVRTDAGSRQVWIGCSCHWAICKRENDPSADSIMIVDRYPEKHSH